MSPFSAPRIVLTTGLLLALTACASVGDAATPTDNGRQSTSRQPGETTTAVSPVARDASISDRVHRAQEPVRGVFGPDSEWKRDVRDAPINQQSDAIVANLTQQVADHYGGVAAFNDYDYNVSFYRATATTPRIRVGFDDCQGKGYVPSQLYTQSGGHAFRGVPIPAQAVPATGTDSELTIWEKDTDQLWELWHARQAGGRWSACWGGRIDHVSRNPGYFPNGTGAAATGMAVIGGAIGLAEARSGTIHHAIDLQVVTAAHYDDFSYPAQRSDGSAAPGTPGAIPEGLRFRLDPSFDVASADLTPLGRMIAKAAQKYGFIVNNQSGAVGVSAENGAPTSAITGHDPWASLRGDLPSYEIMRNFPWSHLQALPSDYGKG